MKIQIPPIVSCLIKNINYDNINTFISPLTVMRIAQTINNKEVIFLNHDSVV